MSVSLIISFLQLCIINFVFSLHVFIIIYIFSTALYHNLVFSLHVCIIIYIFSIPLYHNFVFSLHVCIIIYVFSTSSPYMSVSLFMYFLQLCIINLVFSLHVCIINYITTFNNISAIICLKSLTTLSYSVLSTPHYERDANSQL